MLPPCTGRVPFPPRQAERGANKVQHIAKLTQGAGLLSLLPEFPGSRGHPARPGSGSEWPSERRCYSVTTGLACALEPRALPVWAGGRTSLQSPPSFHSFAYEVECFQGQISHTH